MSRKIFFCLPIRAAALASAFTVLIIFGAGAGAGWYSIYAVHNLPEYNNAPKRVQIFAGVLGVLSTIIFGVSCFGLFALIAEKRWAIRRYLWSSWMTFFLAVPTVTMFALLLWLDDAWGAKNCTYNSGGKATSCEGPSLGLKIFVSLVAAYGLVVQLYLTVILRLQYEELRYHPVKTADVVDSDQLSQHDLPNPYESDGFDSNDIPVPKE